MKTKLLTFLVTLTCVPLALFAEENFDALEFDPPINAEREFVFESERDLYLALSEFRIVEAKYLSNKKGERWALLTIINLANDSRTFKSDQLLAFFANGEHRHPRNKQQRFRPGETLSLTMNFGVSKFPIVKTQTRLR